MTVRVHRIELFRHPLQTRFPFRYGIAEMTDVPALFVRATVEVDGQVSTGISADILPPKWFSKNADTDFEADDLPQMLQLIDQTADLAVALGAQPSPFRWWQALYGEQQRRAADAGIPPLLAGFGVSLMERSLLDACCREAETTLFRSLRDNHWGVDFAAIRPSLDGLRPADILPAKPLSTLTLRHTVGLADPLTDDEIAPSDRCHDGLPQSLVANIRRFGLRYFKIKVQGDLTADRQRLGRLAALLSEHVGTPARITLDGNEQYLDIHTFRSHWDQLRCEPEIRDFFRHALLFVEQPLHRDHALNDEVRVGLNDWHDAPPIIIDESDAELASLPTAIELGYAGTSHKNCKGIFKGLLGAATVAARRVSGHAAILSAEDLVNIGPVALQQDLAMVAALGIEHVERNGHHYFAGLSQFPETIQVETLRNHDDLFTRDVKGAVRLNPISGSLRCDSVNAAPFGVGSLPDLTSMESLPR